jgi:hypothetical protein
MKPEKITCPCCVGTFERDEMMGDMFRAETTSAIHAYYGMEICIECADAGGICEECGVWLPEGHEVMGLYGARECEAHAGHHAEWVHESRTHERQERHGWEQV